jgi:hypothetical protein
LRTFEASVCFSLQKSTSLYILPNTESTLRARVIQKNITIVSVFWADLLSQTGKTEYHDKFPLNDDEESHN